MLAKTLADGFVPQNYLKKKDIVWLNAKTEPLKLYGIFFDPQKGRYLRMSSEVLKGFDTVFNNLNADTSGGRLRFATDSPYIALFADQENNLLLNTMTLCGHSGFDLYKEKTYAGTFLPKTNVKKGFCDIIETDGKMAEYTVNFPLFDNVKELYIGLSEDALVLESEPYKNEGAPIVFYGSSITQGACASRPGNCYVTALCREIGADFVNLGFAGRCHGEAELAEYIAGLKMSAFVLDYDHNSSDLEELSSRHPEFYETVRKAHPEIPVVMISAPDIATGKKGFRERREIIRETYENALKNGDNVYFIDGEGLYGSSPFDATVDGTHPNDMGFYFMKEEIKKCFKNIEWEGK